MSDEAATGPEKDDNDAAQWSSFPGDQEPVVGGDNRLAKKVAEAFIRRGPLRGVVVTEPLYRRDGKARP
jgi:hypothetical protein